LDIMKICMDFGPYDTFPSFDVPEWQINKTHGTR
jgi:hypothetical protein